VNLERRAKIGLILGLCLAVALMLGLRCVALDSDAYPGLSWSSALLTDEGFYIHDARNRVLFGHAQTDQFSNALIMPVLDAVQTGVFHLFGVSVVSARAISVALGLLTLPVFFDAMRRAFGLRPAVFALLLLGLDHVSLLYSRLALMDTPAAFVLVCAFWLWVKSVETSRKSRIWFYISRGTMTQREIPRWERIWPALCGLALGACYGVRGLGALVYPVPILLLGWEGWKTKRWVTARESLEETNRKSESWKRFISFLVGLALALGIYAVLWYLPNHAELKRVNHYYLFEQLVPRSLNSLRLNVTHALFGDDRGFSPYLFRHAPVQFVLALLGLAAWGVRRGKVGLRPAAHRNALYLGLWLLLAWAAFAVVRYSPPRYYIIFYPALTGIAALVLDRVLTVARIVWGHRIARTLLGGFLTYHLLLAGLHRANGITDAMLFGVTILVLIGLFFLPTGRSKERSAAGRYRQGATAVFAVWAVVNTLWIGDWLMHLHYEQRDADRWLAENLPPRSVLIGDAAPGLCLNNRFVAIPVIKGLCNDHQILQTSASRGPRYVVILNGQQNTDWWRSLYPEVIQTQRLKRTFSGLIHFAVTVYEVPADVALPTPQSRKP